MEKEEKCEECKNPYEPDQYYFWCNGCGEKKEKEYWKSKGFDVAKGTSKTF